MRIGENILCCDASRFKVALITKVELLNKFLWNIDLGFCGSQLNYNHHRPSQKTQPNPRLWKWKVKERNSNNCFMLFQGVGDTPQHSLNAPWPGTIRHFFYSFFFRPAIIRWPESDQTKADLKGRAPSAFSFWWHNNQSWSPKGRSRGKWHNQVSSWK